MRLLLLVIAFFSISLNYAFAIEKTYVGRFEGVEVRIISLRDTVTVSKAISTDTKEDKALLKEEYPRGEFRNQHNVMLIKAKNLNILVDAGYPADSDRLIEELRRAGLTPSHITHIILTHGHIDHIGNLVRAGRAFYPNALLLLDKNEFDYWLYSKNDIFKNLLSVYKDKVLFFPEDGVPIQELPQLKVIPAYGHTPGHNMVLLDFQEEPILFIGDIIHAYNVQIKNPDLSIIFDVNQSLAAETRKEIISKYFNAYAIAGTHMPWVAPRKLLISNSVKESPKKNK